MLFHFTFVAGIFFGIELPSFLILEGLWNWISDTWTLPRNFYPIP